MGQSSSYFPVVYNTEPFGQVEKPNTECHSEDVYRCSDQRVYCSDNSARNAMNVDGSKSMATSSSTDANVLSSTNDEGGTEAEPAMQEASRDSRSQFANSIVFDHKTVEDSDRRRMGPASDLN